MCFGKKINCRLIDTRTNLLFLLFSRVKKVQHAKCTKNKMNYYMFFLLKRKEKKNKKNNLLQSPHILGSSSAVLPVHNYNGEVLFSCYLTNS